ncbi:unnamed protein product [Caenorhabditis brenneri]
MYMSIHGNDTYINYEISAHFEMVWFIVLAFVPVINVGFIVNFIRLFYFAAKQTIPTNCSVFFATVMMVSTSLIFSIFDNFTFRIPATGIMTSYCAKIEPNKWLLWVYILQLLSTYWSVEFTSLFCIVRLIVYKFPQNHQKINKFLVRIYTPLAIFLPFAAPWFMYPGVGYCRQWNPPMPFGAIFISFSNTLFEIRLDYFYNLMIGFGCFAIILSNIWLIIIATKQAKVSRAISAAFTQSTKLSLYSTTLCMTIPFAAHGIMTILAYLEPSLSGYVIYVRSPLTDIGQTALLGIYNISAMLRKKTATVAVAATATTN